MEKDRTFPPELLAELRRDDRKADNYERLASLQNYLYKNSHKNSHKNPHELEGYASRDNLAHYLLHEADATRSRVYDSYIRGVFTISKIEEKAAENEDSNEFRGCK